MSEGPKKKAEKGFGRPGNPMNIKQIFRSQRSIGYGIAMLIVAIFPMQASGQNSVLKTRYLRSTFADRIDVAHGNKKPKKVIFLEVIGDFNLRDPERNSIPLTDISLILSTTIDGKLTTRQFEPRGVGLGNGLGRRYVLADEFSSGERHGRSESGECLLKKEKNGKPAVLVVTKNPSQLIFVFDIPKEPEAEYALKIGDTKFVIQRPPSNGN